MFRFADFVFDVKNKRKKMAVALWWEIEAAVTNTLLKIPNITVDLSLGYPINAKRDQLKYI